MGQFKKEITGWKCERCGHEWLSRDALKAKASLPEVCPKCKSPYWNTPRKIGNALDNDATIKKGGK
jgi:predicted Zn-ribbon and HTH transcriptional regulator